MAYDFAGLSAAEFENLVRDLTGAALGVRFEAFAEGPDGGIDGRYAAGDDVFIVQAKHYYRTGFSGLKSHMAKERAKIDALQPTRYILATSVSLTPANKRSLEIEIGPALLSTGDIFGLEDHNALLRAHRSIELSHPRLWQGTATVLEEVVSGAVKRAFEQNGDVPPALAQLLPTQQPVGHASSPAELSVPRDAVFIIKTSPVDDEFTLWLAPKLEAEGYRVFADI
jgi:Restriction endonuclease